MHISRAELANFTTPRRHSAAFKEGDIFRTAPFRLPCARSHFHVWLCQVPVVYYNIPILRFCAARKLHNKKDEEQTGR